jgi:uncharacterized protein YlxP (DUF503 family)
MLHSKTEILIQKVKLHNINTLKNKTTQVKTILIKLTNKKRINIKEYKNLYRN